MRNLLRDFYNPDYYNNSLARLEKKWKENRDCFACKQCIDMSDEYNTYHECKYWGTLPDEHTCLLWEDKDA